MTPWDDIEEAFRSYLKTVGYTEDDFNSPTFDRGNAYNNFDKFNKQQAQGQRQRQRWDLQEALRLPLKLQPSTVQDEPAELLGRSQARQTIENVAVSNCMNRRSTDHGSFSFLIAAGHVRSGKTRMGIETPGIVEQVCKSNQHLVRLKILKPVYLKMDFLNGCRHDKTFDTPGTTPSVALGARLMYAFHGVPNDPAFIDTGRKLKDISHEQAFRYIVSRSLAGHPEESIVPVVCHFDEHGDFTNQLENREATRGREQELNEEEAASRDYFIDMLRSIGSTATSSDSPLREIGGRYFIVPITTGTSKKEANIGGVGNYGVRPVALPVLSYEDTKSLARQFFALLGIDVNDIDSALNQPAFQVGLADTGGLATRTCRNGMQWRGLYHWELL